MPTSTSSSTVAQCRCRRPSGSTGRAAGSVPCTHDDTGVVHVESPAKRSFNLGELFTQWGVSLSADNIGALRSTDGNAVRVFVNGAQRPKNPAAITFADQDEVALVVGPQRPDESIPSRDDFPSGFSQSQIGIA